MNATPTHAIAALADQFRRGTPGGLPDGWENDPVVIAAHQLLAQECLDRLPASTPPNWQGCGIVICGGGPRLFTNAWVCVRMLRHWGCALPIQLWYLGDAEMDDAMRRLMSAYDVTCIDGESVSQSFPVRILHGWELKAFALFYACFREILLLDADNVPVADPTFLFATPEYHDTGALFWPDYGRLGRERSIWRICGVEYRDEPEFESGQIVVDKDRCWQALRLALHYNEHSDFYYRHIHGDKETFHLAFHRTQTRYAMPRRGIHGLPGTMCQHDFQGKRLFQHRNMDKWRLDGSNGPIGGFHHEDLCYKFLEELRQVWCGKVWWNPEATPLEQWWVQELAGLYRYERVGHDQRQMELRPDRTIGRGAAGQERIWTCMLVAGQPSILILGEEGPTCRLVPSGRAWTGRWMRYERMSIHLSRLESRKRAN